VRPVNAAQVVGRAAAGHLLLEQLGDGHTVRNVNTPRTLR
jgi:hypothetical protein